MLHCGIHDVDLFMTHVHCFVDLVEWAIKYSVCFLFCFAILAMALSKVRKTI
jgi:hypothetical protein